MIKTPHLYELIICRSLLDDDVLQCLAAYLEQPANIQKQYEFAARLIDAAEEQGLEGNLLRAYLLDRLANEGIRRRGDPSPRRGGKTLDRG